MEFLIGQYKMVNGNVATITGRHHGSLLDGWIYLDENRGKHLLYSLDSDQKRIVRFVWEIHPYSHNYTGDTAKAKFGWNLYPNFDLSERI